MLRLVKYENFAQSFGRLRQKLHQKACRTYSAIIFPHSTNQIIDLWRCRGPCRLVLNFLLGNLKNGDGNGYDNATNQPFNYLSKEK